MELSESYLLSVPQQRAWEALNDTAVLKASIPGCESIEPDGENAYTLAMTAAVGPVKARFKGRMQVTEIDAPRSYTIVFEGQGGAAGFGKGSAHVTLAAQGENVTELSYSANAQVGGKLAQIGSRLVDGAARKLASEFFKRFGAQMGPAEAEAEAQASAVETSPGQAEAEGDAEQTQTRKRSWTAWISKS